MIWRAFRIPDSGLFEEWESHRFFGRESQVDELLLRLERGASWPWSAFPAAASRLLCARASSRRLALARLPTRQRGWRGAILRPGNQTNHNLAEALARGRHRFPTRAGLSDSGSDGSRCSALRLSGRGLVDVTAAPLAGCGRAGTAFNALVVVDQLRGEIFRYRREDFGGGEALGTIAYRGGPTKREGASLSCSRCAQFSSANAPCSRRPARTDRPTADVHSDG